MEYKEDNTDLHPRTSLSATERLKLFKARAEPRNVSGTVPAAFLGVGQKVAASRSQIFERLATRSMGNTQSGLAAGRGLRRRVAVTAARINTAPSPAPATGACRAIPETRRNNHFRKGLNRCTQQGGSPVERKRSACRSSPIQGERRGPLLKASPGGRTDCRLSLGSMAVFCREGGGRSLGGPCCLSDDATAQVRPGAVRELNKLLLEQTQLPTASHVHGGTGHR